MNLSIKKHREFRRWYVGVLFILPACIFFGVLVLYPTVISFYLSFTNFTSLSPYVSFVGLTHYRAMLDDPNFLMSLKNTIIWSIIYTILSVGGGLLFALILNTVRWVRNLLRMALYYPMALSFVVIGLLWKWMYLPDMGIINSALKSIGLDSLAQPWLGQPSTALYSIIIAASWQQVAYCMVLYLAGLAAIPNEYFEAAQIDGATRLQSIRHVIIPLLSRVSAIAIVTTVLKSFKVFDLVYIMTFGGPGRASFVLPFFMYLEAFRHYRMAYGTAVSVVSLVIVFPFVMGYIRYLSQQEGRE